MTAQQATSDINLHASDNLDRSAGNPGAPQVGTTPHAPVRALQRTQAFRAFHALLTEQEIVRRVEDAIDYMANTLKLDLTLFLYYISWTSPEATKSDVIRYARTALMCSEELPTIIKNWHRPPRKHNAGIDTHAANKALETWAVDLVLSRVNTEMQDLAPAMRSPPSQLSEESLLSIKMDDLIADIKKNAPTTWAVYRTASYSAEQEKRNIRKDPDLSVGVMICMSSFSRSQKSCKMQKMFGPYFKASGTSAKGLDTLHALGISISQKSVYNTIDKLSESSQVELRKDVLKYPWGGLHDNLNTYKQIFEQRLSNQNHFDSGTAATIFIIKDPNAIAPSNRLYRAQFEAACNNPLRSLDIIKLDASASARLDRQAVYHILSFLRDAEPFDFNTYSHCDSNIFPRPPSVFQLATGPSTATKQYMLKTEHIDESSYEGNAACMSAWFRQADLASFAAQMKLGTEKLIVWIGDQLTTSRIRGLKRHHRQDLNSTERYEHILEHFGWFHAQITEIHSLHNQFYGTSAGVGLKHDFDLLKRKGLSSPATQGNFHQNLSGALKIVAEARFRDLWCIVGGVDSLDELRSRTPEQLQLIAEKILVEYASTEGLSKQRTRNKSYQDDVLIQAILFNRDILNYIDLDDAMRTGDVGRMRDLLPRLIFRFIGGGNNNYVTECLEVLQGLEREWPDDLKTFILKYCWLANTTGRPGSFLAFDMLQEHNIRDIKYIFASTGPYATWEYIHRISGSIPTQRKLKDHVEAEINHFFRGKAHTSPDDEEDIALLQASYSLSKIHIYDAKRQINAADKIDDYIAKGSDYQALQRAINNWSAKRTTTRATTEDWTYGYEAETEMMQTD